MIEAGHRQAQRYQAHAAEAMMMAQIVTGQDDNCLAQARERWGKAADECHHKQYPTDHLAMWI